MRKINRDSIPHLVECALIVIRGYFHTILTRIIASWWKVQVGTYGKFHGIPMFRRLPGSTIKIGSHCTFNSAYWSNLIGINHRCILATLHEDAVIEIGNNCGFSGTAIGAASKIIIGSQVLCGANTIITDTDWHVISLEDRMKKVLGATSPVSIEDGVWIGTNVVVLKGVTIGAGTIVAANSVVTKSLPPGVIAAGQPAMVIRKI